MGLSVPSVGRVSFPQRKNLFFTGLAACTEHGIPLTFARRNVNLAKSEPWSLERWNIADGLVWFDGWALAIDVAAGLTLVSGLTVAAVWWRRRRHSLWQFHLLDLLLVSTVIGIVLAAWRWDQRGPERDRAVLTAGDLAAGREPDYQSSLTRRANWELVEPALLGRWTGPGRPRVVALAAYGPDVPHLSGLSRLKTLSILSAIAPTDLTALSRLPALEALDLSRIGTPENPRCQRDGEFAAGPGHVLPPLPSLRGLSLAGADFRGAGLEQLTSLTALDLGQTRFDDAAMPALARLSRLEMLSLNGTQITKASLHHLTGLRQLTVLDLTGIELDATAVDRLSELPQLDELHLSGQALDDNAIGSISRLQNLRELRLVDTRISPLGELDLRQALPAATIQIYRPAAVARPAPIPPPIWLDGPLEKRRKR